MKREKTTIKLSDVLTHDLLFDIHPELKNLRVRLLKASISRIAIERTLKVATITIHTSRPGIIIGKGGQEVETLKQEISKLTNKEIQINI